MVSHHPEDIPAAFRAHAPKAASFIGLDDGEVLKVAQAALVTAPGLPVASRERAAAWERFDEAMGELSARGLRRILAKIREHEANGDELPEALRRAARLDLDSGKLREDGEQG